MAQFGRPSSDVSAGGWAPSTGGDLYAVIDEVVADVGDYAYVEGADTFEVGLSSVDDPVSSDDHVVRWHWESNGTAGKEYGSVTLRQSTTTIATRTSLEIPRAGAAGDFTLTGGEADTITDYSLLRLQFSGVDVGGAEEIRVNWAEFECPDASTPPLVVSPAAGTSVVASAGPSAVIYGSLTISPAAGTGVVASVNPTVILGSITIAPAAVTAVVVSVDPTVIEGAPPPLVVSPAAVSAVCANANPDVILGSVAITPAAGTGVTSTYDPTVIYGSLVIVAAVVAAVCGNYGPTVVYGSVSVTPSAASCVGARHNPTVIDGSGKHRKRSDVVVTVITYLSRGRHL